jgi:hypothetical protein
VRREDVDMRHMRKSWERTGMNWGRDTMGKTEKEKGKGGRLLGVERGKERRMKGAKTRPSGGEAERAKGRKDRNGTRGW